MADKIPLRKKSVSVKKDGTNRLKTKGSWFNVIACILCILWLLFIEIGFADAFLQKSKLSTIPEIIGFGISVVYTLVIVTIVACGALFNFVSVISTQYFEEIYKKHQILVKIDNFLDAMLWWAIWLGVIGGFLLQVTLIELLI